MLACCSYNHSPDLNQFKQLECLLNHSWRVAWHTKKILGTLQYIFDTSITEKVANPCCFRIINHVAHFLSNTTLSISFSLRCFFQLQVGRAEKFTFAYLPPWPVYVTVLLMHGLGVFYFRWPQKVTCTTVISGKVCFSIKAAWVTFIFLWFCCKGHELEYVLY